MVDYVLVQGPGNRHNSCKNCINLDENEMCILEMEKKKQVLSALCTKWGVIIIDPPRAEERDDE